MCKHLPESVLRCLDGKRVTSGLFEAKLQSLLCTCTCSIARCSLAGYHQYLYTGCRNQKAVCLCISAQLYLMLVCNNSPTLEHNSVLSCHAAVHDKTCRGSEHTACGSNAASIRHFQQKTGIVSKHRMHAATPKASACLAYTPAVLLSDKLFMRHVTFWHTAGQAICSCGAQYRHAISSNVQRPCKWLHYFVERTFVVCSLKSSSSSSSDTDSLSVSCSFSQFSLCTSKYPVRYSLLQLAMQKQKICLASFG